MSKKLPYDGGLTCALSVSDIGASMQWYQEVLGFELLYHLDEMGWCELKSPVAKVNVGLSQVEKMPAPGGNGKFSTLPQPVSPALPVPGYSGAWWLET